MKTTGNPANILTDAMAALGTEDHVPMTGNDFIGPEGMAHCGVCREAKEYRLPNGRYVPALCLCGRKRRAAEEIQRREAEEMQRVTELARYSIMDDRLRAATFDAATIRDDGKRPFEIARRYVANFDKVSASPDLNGLLLYGPTGTGKSYLAACVANALMARRVPVLMTSIIRLTGIGADDLAETLRQMKRAQLLILDDLGAERGTDFKLEQVYNIIDDRANSNRPMLVTTNLTMDDMKNAGDMRYNRIWERVRSMCYPVRMDGESWRRQTTLNAMNRLKRLYEG